MRILFAGTPPFAAAALEALADAGHDLVGVLTQPDRPAGRGMKLAPGAVKQAALARGLTVLQPASLKTPEAQAELAALNADVMVVAAYGLILPQAVLDLPRLGCLNIHASLLPRWRGAAPIQRALEAGDAATGVTVMQMEAGLDTGPMLLAETVQVGAGETAATLHDRLAVLGGRLIAMALQDIDNLKAVPQPAAGVTYARKIGKDEAAIDWTRPAAEIERRIRAFDPFPGSTARLGAQTIKVWRARLAEGSGQPGEILAVTPAGIAVACGDGALTLVELQKPGGSRLAGADFLRGFPISAGQRFS